MKNDSNYRNILLTGSSSGIGFEAAKKILSHTNKLILTFRDQNSLEDTLNKLSEYIPSKSNIDNYIDAYIVDLSDLEQIKNFTEKLLNKNHRIDSIVLNAGLQYTGGICPIKSKQNHELTFAVNHLCNQYIAQKLYPLLLKSKIPRVVITSSEVHNPNEPGGKIGEPAGLGTLEGMKEVDEVIMIDGSSKFNADKAYKDSKLCNILFARELSRRFCLKGYNISVIAWAPGLVIPRGNKGFFRYSRKNNYVGQMIFALFARDILHISESPNNAGNLLKELCCSDQFFKPGFGYWSNKLKGPGRHNLEESLISSEANNDDTASNLWELTTRILSTENCLKL